VKRFYLVCLFPILITTLLFSQANSTGTANIGSWQANSQARANILEGFGKSRLGFELNSLPIHSGTTSGRNTKPPANQLFSPAAPYESGGLDAYSVTVADVNGDGKTDILVANACASSDNCDNGSVAVLLNNGDGAFQKPVSYSSGGYYAVSVAVADVNGDGAQDLVVANACSNTNCQGGSVDVLLGNGDGTFQAAVSYGAGGFDAQSVAIGDINGDGRPDLVVTLCALNGPSSCGDRNGGIAVLLGNGDGTFQAAVGINSSGVGAKSVALADVNGDGKTDLLIANLCTSDCMGAPYGGVVVMLGNGDATFQEPVNYGSGGFMAVCIVAGDVNGDGKLDLIVANENSLFSGAGSIAVLLGRGDGTFEGATTFGPDDAGGYFGGLALGDFDRDGKLDIASGFSNSVMLGNGDGTFQSSLPLGASGYGIAVGQFNRDRRQDLAVVGGSNVDVLLNISVLASGTSAGPHPVHHLSASGRSSQQ